MQNQIFRQSLTREARMYAVRELARRAGVTREFFESWKIEVHSGQTTVNLVSDGLKKIVFPHAPADRLDKLAAGNFPVAEAEWLEVPNNPLLKQNLCLPFA